MFLDASQTWRWRPDRRLCGLDTRRRYSQPKNKKYMYNMIFVCAGCLGTPRVRTLYRMCSLKQGRNTQKKKNYSDYSVKHRWWEFKVIIFINANATRQSCSAVSLDWSRSFVLRWPSPASNIIVIRRRLRRRLPFYIRIRNRDRLSHCKYTQVCAMRHWRSRLYRRRQAMLPIPTIILEI